MFTLDPQMQLGYVQLRVLNIDTQKAYYEALGFQLLAQTPTRVVFGAGSDEPVLILEQQDNSVPRPPRTTGLFHFAILVKNVDDLTYTIGNLAQRGVRFSGAGDHLYSEAFYLTDPEGNGIEIYHDRPQSEWTINEDGTIETDTLPVDVEAILARFNPDEPWTGFREGTILGHMHLNVSNLDDTLKHLYFEALGFDFKTNFHNSAYFISAGGYHHHIALNTWNGKGAPLPPMNASGLMSYSLNLSSEAALDALRQNLINTQVAFEDNGSQLIVKDVNNHDMIFNVR